MNAAVELAAGDGRVRVVPGVGGAIAGFTLRGVPVLRETPDAAIAAGDVRQFGSYPLVPYSNRIREATLAFDGRTYPLRRNFGAHPHAIHGLGWQRPWAVRDATRDGVTLVLEHAADDVAQRADWPWPFVATQTLLVRERFDGAAVLHATLTIESRADAPFPFGLGWHPYFPKSPSTTLAFAARSVWRNDATNIPVERVPVPDAWRFDDRVVDGIVLDQVYNGWAGDARLAQTAGGLRIGIAADSACGRLVVYVPEGRDFLAVEPVTHETDAFNRADAGEAATGTRVLRPGGAFSCTMRVTAEAIS